MMREEKKGGSGRPGSERSIDQRLESSGTDRKAPWSWKEGK